MAARDSASASTTSRTADISARALLRKAARAGWPPNSPDTSTVVPGLRAAGRGPAPLISVSSFHAQSDPRSRLVIRTRATAASAASASPRNPNVRIPERSPPSSFEVAWRATDISRSSGDIPAPSSSTVMRSRPPPETRTVIQAAPASSAFSASSLTAAAGRSMTSPARMRRTVSSGRMRMGMGWSAARLVGGRTDIWHDARPSVS